MKLSRVLAVCMLAGSCALPGISHAQAPVAPAPAPAAKELPAVPANPYILTVHSYDMKVPVVRLKNPHAMAKVNSTLQAIAAEDMKQFSFQPLNIEGNFSYEVKYDDDNLLSLIITDYHYNGGAHGSYTQTGVVFDKKTGDQLPLSYFVHLGSTKQLLEALAKGEAKLLNQDMQEIAYRPEFSGVGKALPTSYALAGDGGIYIIYPPYALGPASDGATRVYLSKAVVNELNKRNP